MNKTVLITGSSKRIGAAIAEKFALSSWNVIIHYNKSKKDALNLIKKLKKSHSRLRFYKPIYVILNKEKPIERSIYII